MRNRNSLGISHVLAHSVLDKTHGKLFVTYNLIKFSCPGGRMKILITSDNHLGYKENDPIRSEDSYITFEEVLSIALKEDVDLILQGGDLFHENKPSRDCLNKTICLLRKYCVGEKKCELKSNRDVYDRNISISIPVIAIHGNHDDPSGVNMISPIDILQSCGLVNYIGKYENVDRMDVHPLLLEKEHRVAIYGFGHVKERRLQATILNGGLVFHKQKDQELWYNILVVHQNRIPRDKMYFPEDVIDDFFDLVIYGHEHESVVIKSKFLVLQPGSTIRTSLCEAESHDKYVYILDIGKLSVLEHVRLNSVRPLLFGNLKVSQDGSAEDVVATKIQEMMKNFEFVSERIGEVNRTIIDTDAGRVRNETDCGLCNKRNLMDSVRSHYIREKSLPLVKLRIDAEKGVTLNKHKLGLQFKGLVANSMEMLSISRREGVRECIKFNSGVEKIDLLCVLRNIFFNVELGVLTRARFCGSLQDFVFRGEKEAFVNLVKGCVQEIVNKIDYSSIACDDVERAIKNISCSRKDEDDVFCAERTKESHAYIPQKVSDILCKRFLEMSPVEVGEEKQIHNTSKCGRAQNDDEEKRMRREEEDTGTDASFSFSKYL